MMTTMNDCVERLGSGLREFPWANHAAYAEWLAQTYFYVRHSTRLLAAAAGRFPQTETGDALHQRFVRHMVEERKHERLALHDLRQLGCDTSALVERDSTRMFYECQYYKVEHLVPTALFGYIMALEVMSATHGPWVFKAVAEVHGANAATFLKLHSEEDEKHTKEAFAMLERLTPAERVGPQSNLQQSTYGYLVMLRDIAGAVSESP